MRWVRHAQYIIWCTIKGDYLVIPVGIVCVSLCAHHFELKLVSWSCCYWIPVYMLCLLMCLLGFCAYKYWCASACSILDIRNRQVAIHKLGWHKTYKQFLRYCDQAPALHVCGGSGQQSASCKYFGCQYLRVSNPWDKAKAVGLYSERLWGML